MTDTMQEGAPASAEASTTTETQKEATRRFRVAAFIQRNANRAGKRVVMTGKATKDVAANIGRGAINQVTAPYSGLKLCLTFATLIVSAAALWYVAIVALLAIAGGTGSWLLAIIGAVALYTVLARFVYLPMSMLAASYLARAQDYRMQPTTHRRVDLRRSQVGFSFTG
ncbi:MAG: hypothetical protein E6R03_11110 [Hyphomicrobiaceae bacterium]|nr:MAG: hypothetical protein E6R03_11110 [Hyphomicrobiaceae bacterium]